MINDDTEQLDYVCMRDFLKRSEFARNQFLHLCSCFPRQYEVHALGGQCLSGILNAIDFTEGAGSELFFPDDKS